ncbi:thiolase family protein [Lacticaseibacillus thailandensis]|uniref:acetyl-CoA C-acetyltransferase n=1 Tax=Lacticaseibacillus thailandensis DSM 22698 = JCM 13996 TaxID=1423810 RepID=A0A0R2CCQ4_9LACO|nr:acetyl-CoA C-acyltransferase [Lacticaseibacillus thailandensis]KRM87780.1 acetyl-CoA acetyltransferase [Lacticaseibacillus thailandensis DSM 22698 = JCM 13996]
MTEVVIAGAVRTPIGKIGGALASKSAVELGVIAAQAAMQRAGVQPEQVQRAIFGNVYQANGGQNVARQIALNSGLPERSTAMTVNEVCGSGLQAIHLGFAAIQMGEADVVLVGGTESMSNVPFYLPQMRWGHVLGDGQLTDGLLKDGLLDAFSGQHMGITAENVAAQYHVSREQQDEFALKSHQKAVAAQAAGRFDAEIIPVTVHQKQGDVVVAQDQAPRPDTSLAKLAHLRPAFKQGGTVTAGNASGLNDGASAMLLMSKATAQRLGVAYQAIIDDFAEVGVDPQLMGYAPKYVVEQLVQRAGVAVNDIDRYEINEAFAAQSVAVVRDLGVDADRVNVNGGAVALGHPLGDSGARIVTTLIYALQQATKTTGIAALCIGGGLGLGLRLHREVD